MKKILSLIALSLITSGVMANDHEEKVVLENITQQKLSQKNR